MFNYIQDKNSKKILSLITSGSAESTNILRARTLVCTEWTMSLQ